MSKNKKIIKEDFFDLLEMSGHIYALENLKDNGFKHKHLNRLIELSSMYGYYDDFPDKELKEYEGKMSLLVRSVEKW